jgi:hypothetical protein
LSTRVYIAFAIVVLLFCAGVAITPDGWSGAKAAAKGNPP